MRVVADGIGEFRRTFDKLAHVWEKLPRDGIMRVGGVDQRGDLRRHGDAVTLLDREQILRRLQQAGAGEVVQRI